MPRVFKPERVVLILFLGGILFGSAVKDAQARVFTLDGVCNPLCTADPPDILDATFNWSVNLVSSSTGAILNEYNGYPEPQWNPNHVRPGDAILLDSVFTGYFTLGGPPQYPMDGATYSNGQTSFSMGPPTGQLPSLVSSDSSIIDCGGGGGGLDKFIQVAKAIDIGGGRSCTAKAPGIARIYVKLSGVTAQAPLTIGGDTYTTIADFSFSSSDQLTYLVEVSAVPSNEPPVAACDGVNNITSNSAELNWTFSDADNDPWLFSLWEVASDENFVNLVDSDLVTGGVGTDTTTNLAPETTYWWQVQVADDFGWSDWAVCPSLETAAAPAEPLPQCVFFPNPIAIIRGQSSDLIWNCQNVSACSIDQGVGPAIPASNGSVSVSPTQSTLYTLTCQGVGGNSNVSVQIPVDVTVFSPTRKEIRP